MSQVPRSKIEPTMTPPRKKNPGISIVTCSYQQQRFLDAAMRSVLEQRYVDLEYIVIDGGSTDGSQAVIERHADRLHYWVSEPDSGQTDALIKGFRRSTATLQGWLCSDDLLLPGALDKVCQYFADHPDVDAVYGDSLWIDAAGHYLRPKKEMAFNRFTFLFDHNYISQPSMFWRRSLYEKVGGLDDRFNLAMDADLWERFSRHTRIAHMSAYLSCMRYYPQQKTRAMRPRSMQEVKVISRRASLAARILWPILHASARVHRILMKTLAGGYHAQPPPVILASLKRFYIPGEPS